MSSNSVGPPRQHQLYAPQRGNTFPVRAQQASNELPQYYQRGRPQQPHRGQQQPQRGQTQNQPNRFSQPAAVEADYASADYAYPADYQEYDYADYFAVSGPSSRPVTAQSTGTNSGGGSYYYPPRYPSYYYPGYPPYYYPGYYNYPATAGQQASTSTSTACGNSGCAAAAAAASGGAVSSSSSTSGGAGMSTL